MPGLLWQDRVDNLRVRCSIPHEVSYLLLTTVVLHIRKIGKLEVFHHRWMFSLIFIIVFLHQYETQQQGTYLTKIIDWGWSLNTHSQNCPWRKYWVNIMHFFIPMLWDVWVVSSGLNSYTLAYTVYMVSLSESTFCDLKTISFSYLWKLQELYYKRYHYYPRDLSL